MNVWKMTYVRDESFINLLSGGGTFREKGYRFFCFFWGGVGLVIYWWSEINNPWSRR